MLAALPPSAYVVALQVGGRALSSEQLAQFLEARARMAATLRSASAARMALRREIDARAELRWSLSALTLPHALARVVVAEALYRAVSIIKGHPYHRGDRRHGRSAVADRFSTLHPSASSAISASTPRVGNRSLRILGEQRRRSGAESGSSSGGSTGIGSLRWDWMIATTVLPRNGRWPVSIS